MNLYAPLTKVPSTRHLPSPSIFLGVWGGGGMIMARCVVIAIHNTDTNTGISTDYTVYFGS